MRLIIGIAFWVLFFPSYAQSDSTRNAIIIEPLSPVSDNFTFGYRRTFDKIALKGEIGIITSFWSGSTRNGQFLKLSIEFENVVLGDSERNFMFVQIVPAKFKLRDEPKEVKSMALIFGVGERIKTGRLFFEYFSGIGMAATNNKGVGYNYGFLKLTKDVPLVVSLGFSMGYKF